MFSNSRTGAGERARMAFSRYLVRRDAEKRLSSRRQAQSDLMPLLHSATCSFCTSIASFSSLTKIQWGEASWEYCTQCTHEETEAQKREANSFI